MPEPRFVYHANAAGVGGRFTRIDLPNRSADSRSHPVDNADYIVPIQGASCLPVFGGLSESTGGPYSFSIEQPLPKTLMSVGTVYTRALSSHPAQRPYRAEVEARVSDLQFIERITVRHAVARMVALHDGTAEDGPELRPECCELEGLLLDGYPVPVRLNTTPFCTHPTFGHLRRHIRSFLDEFGCHLHLGSRRDEFCDEAGQEAWERRNEPVVGTIVSDIILGDNAPREVSRGSVPNSIRWEGVGEIFLGELLMTRTERRLTMVRIQFGSDIGGSGGGPEVQGNSGPVQQA